MSNNKKSAPQGVQPTLRFPEFRDAEGWQKKPLEKFLDYQQPTPYLVADTNYSNDYETPVLTAGKTFLLGYTNERHGIFKDDLPVIIFDDFTTATQFVDFPFKAKSSAMKILQAKNGASIKFMYEAMQMIAYEVGTHERHWISKFAPMSIPIPVDLKEQQKIADCLSSLDELIEAEDKKLDTLQQHKKGLMQELFPAKGETLPTRRFPEFKNAPEWAQQALGEIADYENGKAHEQDISSSGKYVVVNSKFISTEGAVRKFTNEGRCIAKKGEILMVLSDVPNGRAIAKSFLIDEDHTYTVNQRICKIKPRKNVSKFLLYIIDRNEFYLSFDDGVNQTNLRKEDVLSCPVILPPEREEQKRIADCLSSLDDLITVQAQKIDALKIHKKGLMQQLFPTLSNESEG